MKECTRIESWKLKYNFVFLFAGEGYFRYMFGDDFYKGDYSRVYHRAFASGAFLQKLFRLHWAYKLNCIVPLPFKSIWFPRIIRQDFIDSRPLCFVYLGGNSIRYDGGLTKYIRKKLPDARQVILHLDLISKKCQYDYSELRDKVDACVTYDKDEAERYGIHWYPHRFYSRCLPLTEPELFSYDAYFLGHAKDRLGSVLQIYHKLHDELGFRCKFILTGVPKPQQLPLDGVSYVDGISYEENLQYVQRSKCILEIGQGGTSASTLRLDEALTYRRLLLSNCTAVKDSEYYFPEIVSLFSTPEDIDVNFLRRPIDYRTFERKNIDLSPNRFLQFLEHILEEQESGL